MARSNCLLFAWAYRKRWRRRWREAGYVGDPGIWGERPTRHLILCGRPVGWHWMFTVHRPRLGGVWHIHFEPRHPIVEPGLWGLLRGAIHKLLYDGRIRRYDTPWRDRADSGLDV